MPKTNTPSDEKMIEALARKMGWRKIPVANGPHGMLRFQPPDSCAQIWWPGCSPSRNWNPLKSLDQVYRLEERLTEEERDIYLDRIVFTMHCGSDWAIRHADARTCATALCRVIAPELFEGGGE